MGMPVVHFEITGRDGEALKRYYAELFGWDVNSENPMNYGVVDREQNLTEGGVGIGGGISTAMGSDGGVTVYVQVPDVEEALAKAEALGGTRLMGPDEVMEGLVIGIFNDPEGHMIGVMSS
jgi:predicted enzyme related to lactoylglutathione lyase